MIVRDLGAGGRWYVVAVHYPSALQAKRAWERAERKLDLSAGDEGIGLYRMSPRDRGGTIESGAPEGVHPVAAITLDERTARKAERLLRDGASWAPRPDFADALIVRRARVVTAQTGEGRILIRRPDARGARLDSRGVMHERKPGRG